MMTSLRLLSERPATLSALWRSGRRRNQHLLFAAPRGPGLGVVLIWIALYTLLKSEISNLPKAAASFQRDICAVHCLLPFALCGHRPPPDQGREAREAMIAGMCFPPGRVPCRMRLSAAAMCRSDWPAPSWSCPGRQGLDTSLRRGEVVAALHRGLLPAMWALELLPGVLTAQARERAMPTNRRRLYDRAGGLGRDTCGARPACQRASPEAEDEVRRISRHLECFASPAPAGLGVGVLQVLRMVSRARMSGRSSQIRPPGRAGLQRGRTGPPSAPACLRAASRGLGQAHALSSFWYFHAALLSFFAQN